MDFVGKFKVFWELFIVRDGWVRVVTVGLVNTLLIAVLGLLIGIVIGTLIAAVKVMPKYKKWVRILDKICTVYVGFFRGTPLVVQLLITYYVMWPMMGIAVSSLNTAIIVFGLNSGAYVSEIVRGGIQSVDPGQREAAAAMGMTHAQTMIYVVLPQAIRRVLPVYKGELISLIKNTSIVGYVAVADLTRASYIIRGRTFDPFFPLLMVAILYFLIAWLFTQALDRASRKIR